jgi:hypothetical protein
VRRVSAATHRGRAGLKPRAAVCLAIVLSIAGSACDTLTGDAATRFVSAVRDGATRLASSRSDTLVLSVAAKSWPGGCPDGYRVEWRADSDRIPGLGVICTTGSRGYATIGYRQFLKVPRPLQVTKAKGEPTTIALRKGPGGAIEVTALQ